MAGYWERIARQRTSRRAVLRGAAMAGAAAAGAYALGCSDSGSGDPTPVATQQTNTNRPDVLNEVNPPRRGGRMVTAESAPLGTFDPHLGVALASAYFPRVYNVLVNQSATKPEFIYHDLAESFETPDETTYVFKIRPGVLIAPNDLGVPERAMDGEDVRVNLERIKTTATANNYSFAKNYIDSVEVQGDTVTVRTTQPYAWFLNRIGLFVNTIAPRELLTGNLDLLTTRAAGGGAFRLAQATEGQGMTFERNVNYYRRDDAGEQLPYVDGLDLSIINDSAALQTAFRSKQILRYRPGTPSEVRTYGEGFVTAKEPLFNFIAFSMNPRNKPFDDARVRRAFSRAINRDDYTRIIYEGDAQADGLVHWPLGDYALPPEELASERQPFDIADAKKLIEAVGGIKVKMMYPTGVPLLEHPQHLPIFLEQMKAVGIEIDHDPQDLTRWIDNYYKLNYDCSLALNQFYETPEIPLDFHTSSGALGDKTYVVGMGDPEIDAAVRKTKEELDTQGRIELVHAAQRVIYDKDPTILPIVSAYAYETYWDDVKNIPTGIGTTKYLIDTYWIDTSGG